MPSQRPGKIARRTLRAISGDWPGDEKLRWLAVGTILSGIAFSALWGFIGIWAVTELRVSSGTAGILFLFDAVGGAIGGIVGGRYADKYGRGLAVATGWFIEGVCAAALLFCGHSVVAGFGLVTLASAAGGIAMAASGAIVADLVAAPEQESAYAAIRVAMNFAFVLGPPIGGLLLLGADWNRFYISIGAFGVIAGLLASQKLRTAETDKIQHDEDESSERGLIQDRIFLAFLVASAFAFVTSVGLETILPIIATSSYGISPTVWGAVIIVNPAIVMVLQMRVVNWVQRYHVQWRIGVGVLLMALSFLCLLAAHGIVMIIVVILIFSVGEILWNPTASAVVGQLAPASRRGSYMGAFGVTTSVAWAIGPLAGLELRQVAGVPALWQFIAVVGVIGAVLGVWSTSAKRERLQAAPQALPP